MTKSISSKMCRPLLPSSPEIVSASIPTRADHLRHNRRRFLGLSLSGMAAAGMALPNVTLAQQLESSNQRGNPRTLKGPIVSIPTPFTADFSVDYEGVQRMVLRALKHGLKNFSLTAGNGCYHALTYDEIKQLTRTVAECVNGQGFFIAAAGDWWTGQTIQYARFAESVGADAVQITLPSRTDEDGQVAHFREIAKAVSLGIVLHGKFFSVPLLQRLIEIESIFAMKEDSTIEYYIDRQREFGDRLVVFAGGPKSRYLAAHPHGSRAFYTLYGTFAPEIPGRFWQAIQKGDLQQPHAIVERYERPYFDRWSHAFWRASLEHFNVAQRYLRPPERSFSDEQMRDVEQFFNRLGLDPQTYAGE